MTATHLCCWPGCKVRVEARFWGCPAHWRRLPWRVRHKILETYRPGQSNPLHIEAIKQSQRWALEYGQHTARKTA